MKKHLAVLAAMALLASPSVAVCGDVDTNGTVNILDALVTAQASASLLVLSPAQIDVADVDSSGAVNILDGLLIAQFAASMPVTLGCVSAPPPPPPPAIEKIYVGTSFPNVVVVIDHSTDQIIGNISISHDAAALAADPVRDVVYVASSTGNVSIVDTVTDTVTSTFVIPTLTGRIDVTPDGSTLVGVTADGMVIVELPAHTVRANVFTGSSGYSNFIATSPDSLSAWMSQSDRNTVVSVDLTTDTVDATISVGSGPYGIDVSPTGDMVFVINHFDETMSRIDTATDTEIMPRNPVGIYPMGILAHSTGTALAVNCISGNVSEHDPVTGGQIAVFAVGAEPINIDEAPGGDVSVANTFSNSVTIFDVSTGGRTDVVVGGSVTDVVSK